MGYRVFADGAVPGVSPTATGRAVCGEGPLPGTTCLVQRGQFGLIGRPGGKFLVLLAHLRSLTVSLAADRDVSLRAIEIAPATSPAAPAVKIEAPEEVAPAAPTTRPA